MSQWSSSLSQWSPSPWPSGWHKDNSGLHSSAESVLHPDARPVCLLPSSISRVSAIFTGLDGKTSYMLVIAVVLRWQKCPLSCLWLQVCAQHGVCGGNWPHWLWWGGGRVDHLEEWGPCEGPGGDWGEHGNMRTEEEKDLWVKMKKRRREEGREEKEDMK